MYIYFIGFLIALIWGIQPVLQKKMLTNLSHESVMIIGGLLYFVLILIYFLINKNKVTKEINTLNDEQKKMLLFIAIISFIASMLYYHALSIESSSKVSMITSIWPIFAVLFGILLLNEKFNPKLLFGIIAILLLVNYIEN